VRLSEKGLSARLQGEENIQSMRGTGGRPPKLKKERWGKIEKKVACGSRESSTPIGRPGARAKSKSRVGAKCKYLKAKLG